MFGRLMPREGRFFELFNAHAERIVEGSRELAAMMTSFDGLETHAQRIDGAERAADKITTRRSPSCTRPSSRRSTATRSIR
jgi:hypothetical protein